MQNKECNIISIGTFTYVTITTQLKRGQSAYVLVESKISLKENIETESIAVIQVIATDDASAPSCYDLELINNIKEFISKNRHTDIKLLLKKQEETGKREFEIKAYRKPHTGLLLSVEPVHFFEPLMQTEID